MTPPMEPAVSFLSQVGYFSLIDTIACNIGYVYGNKTYINFNTACTTVAGSGDLDATYECECCEFSFPVSKYV